MPRDVLVVEDSRAMRQFVRAILESSGEYAVVEVDNGFEALRTLPRQPFAVVITDINMPDVSGIEVTRFIRGHAQHRNTPVVVISTDASSVDAQRAKAAGASSFLPKPFEGKDLLAAIDEALAAHASDPPGPRGDADD